MARGGKRLLIIVPALAAAGIGASWWAVHARADRNATRDLLAHYCVDCHNPVDLTANLVIDPKSLAGIGGHPEQWGKAPRKLRPESMPPDNPRPPHDDYARAAAVLGGRLHTPPT